MGQFEKEIERLKCVPSDYTFKEIQNVLEHLGYRLCSKGKTSGSRLMFYRENDEAKILVHRPHPSDIMKEYSIKQILGQLKEHGDI